MTSERQGELSSQDRQVMDLLEEAKKLYEQYQNINNLPLLPSPSSEPSYPQPTWDSPLTLVVKTPK
jgi:hypothetical protein